MKKEYAPQPTTTLTTASTLDSTPTLSPKPSWWQVWRPVVGLCLTLALINCQPSEPYLTKYLRENKNISEAQLDSKVWPSDTYAALMFLLPLGLLAEHFGCVPVIIFGLLCRQATRVLLLWGENVGMMMLMQITYAAATSSNAIIYAATYITIEKKHYPIATAAVFSSEHVGNIVGSCIGELLVDAGKTSLKTLFYFSWAFTTLGLLAFLLIFVRSPNLLPEHGADEGSCSITTIVMKGGGMRQLWKELKVLYSSPRVLRWSAWWVLAYCQYYVIGNYYQNQFQNIDPDAALGVAEAGIEICAVAGTFAPVFFAFCLDGNFYSACEYGSRCDNERGYEISEYNSIPSNNIDSIRNNAQLFVDDSGTAVSADNTNISCKKIGAKDISEIVLIIIAAAGLGTLYFLSTQVQSSVYYSVFFNAAAIGLHRGMFAYASTVIAECISNSRHLLIFTANTFMSLLLSTIVVSIGSATKLSTNNFFWLAAGQEYSVALLTTLWLGFSLLL